MPCCGTGLGLPYGGTGVDRDALLYFNRASITDPTAKQQILDFVKGVKALGLWNNFVCWPLRSSQNAGTGTTAFSLGGLGTFNGTLVNGFPWGVNGLVKSTAAMELQLPTNSTLINAKASILLYRADGPTGYTQLRPYTLGGCTTPSDTGTQPFLSTDTTLVTFRHIRGGAFTQTSNSSFTGRAFDLNFFLCSLNTSSSLVKINNSAANTQSFASPRTTQAASPSTLAPNYGAYGLNGSAFGSYPFFSVLTSEVNDTQATSLYNLYKTTLGQGLALP